MHEHSQASKHQTVVNPFKKPAFVRRLPMPSTGDVATSPALDTYVTRHVNVKCKEETNVPKKVIMPPIFVYFFQPMMLTSFHLGWIPLVVEPYDSKQKMEIPGAG